MRVDKSVINSLNRKTVLNVIRDHKSIGRAEIARMTNLSLPTVMKICEDLISNQLVKEIGKGKSAGGKPPKLLEFVADSYSSIGIDIGTTNITCVRVDCNGTIVKKNVIPTNHSRSYAELLQLLINCVDSVSDSPNPILGIGIGMPGIIEPQTGDIIFSPNFGYKNINISSPLRNHFNKPVLIDNVTRVMAVAEKNFGVCKGIDNFVCVNLGYGIGSAIMVNGQLYTGKCGSAGEIGHTLIDPNGPKCTCGRNGCLEAMASANSIVRYAKKKLREGVSSIILDMVSNRIDLIEAKNIYDAAKLGDRFALQIVNQAIHYLGIGLATIVTLLDPDCIVLEGGVSRAGNILLDGLNKWIDELKMPFCGKNTKLVVSEFGTEAAAIGAASLVLDKFLYYGGDLEFAQAMEQ